MDNLPELRDIHLPTEGVSVWPLAVGWWGILLSLIIGVVLFKLIKWFHQTSKRFYAKYLLSKYANSDTLSSAVQMSEILRRICLSRYPEAVAFSGKEWIDFLNSKSMSNLSDKTAQLLQNAPYVPSNSTLYNPEDVADLRRFCLGWIGANL